MARSKRAGGAMGNRQLTVAALSCCQPQHLHSKALKAPLPSRLWDSQTRLFGSPGSTMYIRDKGSSLSLDVNGLRTSPAPPLRDHTQDSAVNQSGKESLAGAAVRGILGPEAQWEERIGTK
ncbi:anoctamin-6 [Platysternon megacephalum]|uniref:Anoctamin-6 n=1 Tax=Platysternon megacephalum TaxID=55544 RepID=A0A4D9DRY0_9SAUR|nr:anoctamin-6 [Platysternon megacephalum]